MCKRTKTEKKEIEMAKRKIYPETWVLGSSILVGALIIAFNLRGCKDCAEQEYAGKAKADTVWVNKNVITINGNDNIVNVNQGTENKIENRSCGQQSNIAKKRPAQTTVKQQHVAKTDTVVKREEPKVTDSLANKLVLRRETVATDCHGHTIKTIDRFYYTKVNGEMRLDSIVTDGVCSSDSVRANVVADTCDCTKQLQQQKSRQIQWSWQKSR